MRTLVSYDFPGNIRELKNLIERACILAAGDEIMPENLPMLAPVHPSTYAVADGVGGLTPNKLAE